MKKTPAAEKKLNNNSIDSLLDEKLKEAFVFLDISRAQQSSLETYCNLIKLKDKTTYYHCVRVALCGVRVANLLGLDQKALFYAGLLRDIGKTLIDKEILSEHKKFSASDYKKTQNHSLYGYYLLRGVHNFSAEIILRHHKYAGKKYPRKLPPSNLSLANRALVKHYAEILSLIDFYDAAITRKNKKFKVDETVANEDIKKILLEYFPKQSEIINICYEKGIFGKDIEEIFDK